MKWFTNSAKIRLVSVGFVTGMLFSILSNSPCMSQTNSEGVAAQVDAYLNDLVSRGEFSGSVLIAKGGQVIISKGYGMANYEHDVPNMSYTKFRIYSISKQFAAMGIMILHEAGVLNVHDPICAYIDNCPDAWGPITIYHLLIQSSGLHDYHDAEGVTDLFRLPKTLDMFIDLIRDKQLKFSPGAKIDRNGSNYLLLTAIIESASGKSYTDFVRENVFEPLGMINSGCDNSEMILKHRAAGYSRSQDGNLVNATYELVDAPSGGGHIYSTVEDMCLWDQALETNQLVSQETLDAILKPCASNYGPSCYVLPIPIGGYSREVFGHVGGFWGFRAYFGRIPTEKACLVVLMNIDFGPAGQVNRDLLAMIENIPLLIAHWKLDETEGNIAHDSAGQYDGTLNGNPLWQPHGGYVAGAIQLDGIDDYVSTPFVVNPADREFSVFAWIKRGAPGQVVLSQIGGANWLLADPSEGRLMTNLTPPAGRSAPPLLVSEFVITDGSWHRIGFVWDGSNRMLYVDDVEVAKDTQTQLAGSIEGLYIGAGKSLEPGSFFSGLIDDVCIYDRAVIP
ncbi:MAG: serine hydrolase [Planctomycetota bacterium]